MKMFLLSLVLLQQNAMMLVPSSPCFFLPPSGSNRFPARRSLSPIKARMADERSESKAKEDNTDHAHRLNTNRLPYERTFG
jgi:hypothetical protein